VTRDPRGAPGPHSLNWLFDAYNRQYWGGRLPKYRVIRRAALKKLGVCRDATRTILIRRPQSSDAEALTLLHEMCHIGPERGFMHGPIFQRKVRRLVRLGAPPALLQDLEQYDGTFVTRWLESQEAARQPVDEIPFRDAVQSDLEELAERRVRWATVRRTLVHAYQTTPAEFDRRAPWAEAEWRRHRHEGVKRRRQARALRLRRAKEERPMIAALDARTSTDQRRGD
jgi:hypothetical protein